MHILHAETFAQWREQARDMLQRGLTPLDVTWDDAGQRNLLEAPLPPVNKDFRFSVPKEFFSLAEAVSCHRSPQRWDLLFQLLFRLYCGEKHLLRIATDPLIHALHRMEKAVRRDSHKMKAFVRFRLVQDEEGEHYIAWHRPDHYIVARVAPFFSRRFSTMRWTILTPDASVHWDGETLHHGPGMPQEAAPQEDVLEDLWRNYYRATFNPARIKIKTMKREMPVRHWHTLPETDLISSMLAEAEERVQTMLAHSHAMTSAENFLPIEQDIAHLRQAAKACQGCELHRDATQTVFGTGPENATLMLVGEQPGNEEDLQGLPFIGPAGQLLEEALHYAGITREDIYITNAVKHFRFIYQDSFRHHRSPSRYHITACKPWLEKEIAAVKPKVILCLGNTAARSLINPGFVMKSDRGKWLQNETTILAGTYHPASILRAQGTEQAQQRDFMYKDINAAVQASRL